MDHRSNWELRRPATVEAAHMLLGMLQGSGVIDKSWSLNFRKHYIGLLKGRTPINFVRFLSFRAPTAEFRLPRNARMERGLATHDFSWRYKRGGYQVKLLEADFEREINILIQLAQLAKQAHGGPRDPQGEMEELRLTLEKARDSLSEISNFATEKRSVTERAAGAAEAEVQRITKVRQATESLQQEMATWASEIPKYRELMGRFNENMERTQDLEKRLEAWLERAVPAGMAGGFQKRRRGFIWSKVLWSSLLVVSLGTLAVLAYIDPVRMQVEATFLSALTYVFSRVPYAVPLLWGAFFSSRRFVQTLRLEEEYAHKEVLSGAFESFRKHIKEMEEGSIGEQSNTLIEVFLEMLRTHPGNVLRRDTPKPNRLVTGLSRILRRAEES